MFLLYFNCLLNSSSTFAVFFLHYLTFHCSIRREENPHWLGGCGQVSAEHQSKHRPLQLSSWAIGGSLSLGLSAFCPLIAPFKGENVKQDANISKCRQATVSFKTSQGENKCFLQRLFPPLLDSTNYGTAPSSSVTCLAVFQFGQLPVSDQSLFTHMFVCFFKLHLMEAIIPSYIKMTNSSEGRRVS